MNNGLTQEQCNKLKARWNSQLNFLKEESDYYGGSTYLYIMGMATALEELENALSGKAIPQPGKGW